MIAVESRAAFEFTRRVLTQIASHLDRGWTQRVEKRPWVVIREIGWPGTVTREEINCRKLVPKVLLTKATRQS